MEDLLPYDRAGLPGYVQTNEYTITLTAILHPTAYCIFEGRAAVYCFENTQNIVRTHRLQLQESVIAYLPSERFFI